MRDELPITAVTVHPDGAWVTRAGPLDVVGGRATARRLPFQLDESAVEASVDGAVVSALQLSLDTLGRDRGDEPNEQRALLDAKRAVERIDHEVNGLQSLRATFAELTPGGRRNNDRRGPPTAAGVASWLTVEAAVDERLVAIDARLAALELARRDAARLVSTREQAVREASSEAWWRRWRPSRALMLNLSGVSDGVVQVTLRYRVRAARWTAAYTLNLDGALSRGRLVLRALVAQTSGEDWRGVRLTVCTAPSGRNAALPELPALRLGSVSPKSSTGWRPLPADLESLFPDDPVLRAAAPPAPRPAPPMPTPPPAPPEASDYDEDDEVDAFVEEAPARAEPMAKKSMNIFRGGPPPPPLGASMPAPGAPPSMAAAPSRSRSSAAYEGAAFGGGGGPRPQAPKPMPQELTYDPGLQGMDYGRMRLQALDAPIGARGRFTPRSIEDELHERGGDAGASARLHAALAEQAQAQTSLLHLSLPQHHAVPDGVEGVYASFTAEAPLDVPSAARFNAVALREVPLDLAVSYRAVPREDPRAFRVATARLKERLALTPGPMDVFVAGSLLLTLPWQGAAGGAEVRVDLGPDDALKLSRNVRYREETAGLLRGDRRLFTRVEVRISSSLPRPVMVELLERLPVSRDEGVKVELVEALPTLEVYEGEPRGARLDGGRRQRVQVPASGEGMAALEYAVTLSNKQELMGGDRRG
ncbi:MAG: DUF4139 domain-containing protein [Deltaproteobacteria bacterium]|nr:DUF4139 domain-containing protein [Deltaproteobacteria bacterium]